MHCDGAALCDLLDTACAEVRTLRRVVPQPQELPDFTAAWIAAQREQGWFGEGLAAVSRAGRVVSLVDARVKDQEAQIGWFATHPDYRRKGYATDCLQHALQYARDRGATTVRTHSFIDSRVTAACAFLEHHGFTVRDPDHQNMVLQIDMDQYGMQPVELPDGYELRTLDMNRLDEWLAVRRGVFGEVPEDWFAITFARRWDFDPAGWHMIYHGSQPVGIAGADFHRDPAHPQTISGCQFEYVGVLAEHRGKRLGEMLMYACLNYAKRHHVQPCQLITQRFRTAAVGLYEKLGFRFQRENRTYEKPLIDETA